MSSGLTSVQKELIQILNSFIHAGSCEFSEDFFAFEELYKLAAKHRVSAAVFDTICQDPRVKQEAYSTFFLGWRQHAIREISLQTRKTVEFLRLYEEMEKEGIRPLVVKGIIRRQMYDKPDHIGSSDEDLLIPREDFIKCDRFLLQQGFKRQELDVQSYDELGQPMKVSALPMEVSYYHPQTSVYLEIHTELFPKHLGAYGNLNEDFIGAFDSAIAEKIQGVPVWTLEPTLHIWYLICHSLKHFLHSGFGLRQVCDIVKMAEYYGEQIDWCWIHQRVKDLKLERYWGGILDIAGRFFQFELNEILDQKFDGSALLLDLFDSGIYGSSSLARRQSSNMTLTAVRKGKKSTFVSLWHSLFPGKEYMYSKYKYLKEHPWMMPKAWLSRLGGYVRAQKKVGRASAKGYAHTRKNSAGKTAKSGQNGSCKKGSINIGMQRVELLRKYGLINE